MIGVARRRSSVESLEKLHRQNRSDRRRGSSADIDTWMLWPVLGDDGLSPTSPPASASVKGVNKLAPLLLCAPCKPSSHRKNQSSTQWYVQQVNRLATDSSDMFCFVLWSKISFFYFLHLPLLRFSIFFSRLFPELFRISSLCSLVLFFFFVLAGWFLLRRMRETSL